MPRTPPPSEHSIDIESQTPKHRFEYSPKSFFQRLLVSTRIKTKLNTSSIIRIEYKVAYKYSLIIFLLLIGAFLTPQLLPTWLGFKWASSQDLCTAPENKLDAIAVRLKNLTNLNGANQFLRQQLHDIRCMDDSASDFYHGIDGTPPRFLWPSECDPATAKTSLKETTCVSQSTNVCKKVGGFLGFLAGLGGRCERTVGPDLCVESTHAGRTEALLQLQEERNALNPNVTVSEDEPIINSANTRVQKLISRLMTQVDLASDAFILYSIIAVAIGVPLVVCKREKGSRVIGATFGLRKMWFILLFVGMIALYDTVLAVYRETDFGRLYKNFVKDPCYVDPAFSSMRTALIVDACNNISYINLQSDRALQKMDTLYYDTRLFGFCKDDDRPLAVHPKLDEMDELRTAYREKRISNPGVCNATELNQITSTAPDAEDGSKWKALLGSGVLAQLLLKFVLTSWLVHLIAYIEPMVMHDGKVELWGAESSAELLESEQDALRRFARDKHLLSLVIFSIFMIFEIVLIGYSTWSSLHTVEQLDIVPEISAEPLPELLCPPFLL